MLKLPAAAMTRVLHLQDGKEHLQNGHDHEADADDDSEDVGSSEVQAAWTMSISPASLGRYAHKEVAPAAMSSSHHPWSCISVHSTLSALHAEHGS